MTNWTKEEEENATTWANYPVGGLASRHSDAYLRDALDEIKRLREELIEVWPHRALRCPCSERQRARDIDNPAPWTDCTCGLNEALYAPEGE